MDPEFQRVILRVFLIGGVIAALGAGGLIVAFRSFGTTRRDGEAMPIVITAAVLLFIIVASLLLLRISVAK